MSRIFSVPLYPVGDEAAMPSGAQSLAAPSERFSLWRRQSSATQSSCRVWQAKFIRQAQRVTCWVYICLCVCIYLSAGMPFAMDSPAGAD